jgi:hypothetical protein
VDRRRWLTRNHQNEKRKTQGVSLPSLEQLPSSAALRMRYASLLECLAQICDYELVMPLAISIS